MRSLQYIRNVGIIPSLLKKTRLCLHLLVFCIIPIDSLTAQDSTLSISGSVHYALSDLPADSVKMRLYGGTYKRAFTDSGGRYRIDGIPPGISYIVDPDREKIDDEPLTAFDASLILQHISDRLDLNESQRLAADVTQNGDVSAFDASVILKYVILEGPRHYIEGSLNIGTWSFLPERMMYDSLRVDQRDQDYTGLIIGDVSGNWRQPSVSQDTVAVWIAPQTAQRGDYLMVPVFFGEVQGKNIFSCQGAIRYDESELAVVGMMTVDLGGLTYEADNGRLTMAWADAEPLSVDGIHLYIDIHVSPDAREDQSYPLQFEYFMFNEGNPAVLTGDGTVFIISAPDIALSAFHHDFGYAIIGETTRWEFDISNEGTRQLNINGILIDNPDFQVGESIFVVEPGQSTKVTVSCSPADPGSTVGNIQICSNDPDEPLLSVRVQAVGVTQLLATLGIGDGFGSPGSSDNRVLIYLDNDVDVRGLDMVIYFNPDVLKASKVSSTPRSAHMDLFDADLTTIPGRVRLLVADLRSESIVAGAGSVAKIYFDVLDTAPFGAASLRASEVIVADVRRNPIPVKIEHGHFYVEPRYSISGRVVYCDGSLPVPGVEIRLSGDVFETIPADSLGSYGFSSLMPDGDFCVHVVQQGVADHVLSCFDASLVLRHVRNSLALSACASTAADVTGDGTISIFDAAIIMRYVTCVNIGFQNCPYLLYQTGSWRFQPDSLCYDVLTSSQWNQEFAGTILGDVSQNWPGMVDTLAEPGVMVRLNEIEAGPGESCEMSLTINSVLSDSLKDIQCYSIEARVDYNPLVLTLDAVSESPATQDMGLLMYDTVEEEGLIGIGLAFHEALMWPEAGGVSLVSLRFELSEDAFPGDSCVVHLSSLMLNEGTPRAYTEDGIIRIVETTNVETGDSAPTSPDEFALFQNYPNPFNAYTDVRYQIVDCRYPIHTALKIYNILGQEVRTLFDAYQDAGFYSITWDGRNDQGNCLPSGVYSYRLSVNDGQWLETRRMVLVR